MTTSLQWPGLVLILIGSAACRVECLEPYAERDGECIDQRTWSDTCPASALGQQLADQGRVYAHETALEGGWGFDSPVIQDQAQFDDLAERMAGDVPFEPIDFENNVVVGMYEGFESTCGARLHENGVLGGSTLVVRIEDTSGSCDPVTCEVADMGILVMHQVPRPATNAAVCLEVAGTCVRRD